MKQHSKTSLFLMELILAILLFSLCAGICVRLFVQAHQTEQYASDLTKATLLCDSMAAVLQSSPQPDMLQDCFPELLSPDTSGRSSDQTDASLPFQGYTAFYNKAWEPCGETDAVWRLSILPDVTSRDTVSDALMASDAPASALVCQARLSVYAVSDGTLFYELPIGYQEVYDEK